MSNIDPTILKSIFNVIMADMHIARDINEINIAVQTLITTLETTPVSQVKENLQLFSQEIGDNMNKLILQTDTLCASYDKLL